MKRSLVAAMKERDRKWEEEFSACLAKTALVNPELAKAARRLQKQYNSTVALGYVLQSIYR